ncbi:MAG: hypothetical protein HC941_04035 [Microcoleus sp. SU_5_3]|nr:hypothetical protein [Microcoleus sp. SU_5_3]
MKLIDILKNCKGRSATKRLNVLDFNSSDRQGWGELNFMERQGLSQAKNAIDPEECALRDRL